MKKNLLLILLCFAFQFNYSQENYTVNGETLQLKTEIDGNLDLLWNIIDGKYRYFVKTDDGSITELKNTKGSDKNYQEEYKATLSNLTNGMSTSKLNLTLYSLSNYIDKYNASVDMAYTSTTTESKVQLRLGFSGGITNNPFVGNYANVKVPLIGAELEIYEAKVLPRHSGFLQVRHSFDNDNFSYNTTEFSLGYRYRIINKSSFSIYGQVKLATVNFTDVTYIGENETEISQNDTSFDVPFIFGIGSDIKVGKTSYITIIYGELFALLLDNQGNFSTDIAIGYKFNL
ncbi:hypothetical protein [uncultured Winogradskyella sp.]|uniref:hypothetical protein n=1 Tax=uncultured Winogradskyella sp. TaxID=395353 RepID=UPI0030DCEDD6|tara:strand:+ start:781 stop:1644 length:864 start_codon:yes stop_codon:yes gene_type:complete